MTIPVNLPRLNQTGKNEWADVESNDVALKEGVEKAGEEIDAISGLTWYTPKVIATEESITSTSFKLMSENGAGGTADQIANVVLPENGLIVVAYNAEWKGDGTNSAHAAIFLGSNQLKNRGGFVEEVSYSASTFRALGSSSTHGLSGSNASLASAAAVTTGQIAGGDGGGFVDGTLCLIRAAAGTYTVSVKFLSTPAGKATVKERKLWVATFG